jgi:hypothetical protein
MGDCSLFSWGLMVSRRSFSGTAIGKVLREGSKLPSPRLVIRGVAPGVTTPLPVQSAGLLAAAFATPPSSQTLHNLGVTCLFSIVLRHALRIAEFRIAPRPKGVVSNITPARPSAYEQVNVLQCAARNNIPS